MQAYNHTRQRFLAGKGIIATRSWARLRGLIGYSDFEPGEGLLLMGTQGIHTLGMRFPIDTLFLDEDGRVIHLIHSLKPFRVSPFFKHSAMVLELPAGILQETRTRLGDGIEVTVADGMKTRGNRVWTETEKVE